MTTWQCSTPRSSKKRWCPSEVNRSESLVRSQLQQSLGLIIDNGRFIELLSGAYKPTNITGGNDTVPPFYALPASRSWPPLHTAGWIKTHLIFTQSKSIQSDMIRTVSGRTHISSYILNLLLHPHVFLSLFLLKLYCQTSSNCVNDVVYSCIWWVTLWLCQNSYRKLPFIVELPIENGDFP